MQSLRLRLIITHTLPVLVVIPLLGLAIYLVLLTQSDLTNMESYVQRQVTQLEEQAQLLADVAGEFSELWADPTTAGSFVTDIDIELTTVSLYSPAGELLASDAAPGAQALTDLLSEDEVATLLSGRQTIKLNVRNPSTRAINAFIPVFDAENRLTGILRLSRELANVQQRFRNLTDILIIVTILLLALGIGIGLWLALRLEKVFGHVTTAVSAIAAGQPPSILPHAETAEINSLYAAVNMLAQRLATLEDTRKRLLANLVHELGRPLGSIRAAIQALQQGAVDDPALRVELLSGVDQQIERMQPLLEDLTQLHGQLLGSLELNCQFTPLTPWMEKIFTLWREAALQKEIQWRADIPLGLPTVNIDTNQMSRAIGNLLSNAVKFTPSGGTITLAAGVDTAQEASAVWICVSDNGPGVAAADQERIFEPFKRGETATRFPQGMGLGLAIARDIVHAHGGEIDLISAPGKGAAFTIRLPWQRQD